MINLTGRWDKRTHYHGKHSKVFKTGMLIPPVFIKLFSHSQEPNIILGLILTNNFAFINVCLYLNSKYIDSKLILRVKNSGKPDGVGKGGNSCFLSNERYKSETNTDR